MTECTCRCVRKWKLDTFNGSKSFEYMFERCDYCLAVHALAREASVVLREVSQLLFSYEAILSEMRTHSQPRAETLLREWVTRLDFARDAAVTALGLEAPDALDAFLTRAAELGLDKQG